MQREHAFSWSSLAPLCVDCGGNAERIVYYHHYSIGDLTCLHHGKLRVQEVATRASLAYLPPNRHKKAWLVLEDSGAVPRK